MAYAIIRFEKVKSWSDVAAMSAHWDRSRPTPNADPSRTPKNRVLVGQGTAEQAVRAGLAGLEPRKNAVLAMEAVLTASPEFFEQATPADKQKWLSESISWLKTTYGRNLVSAVLHVDESTPHLHAVILPLDQRGKLNARELFNREHLRHVQQSYPSALKELGLQRGIERSRATHTDLKTYYGAITQPVPAVAYKPLPAAPGLLDRSDAKLAVWAKRIQSDTVSAISPAFSIHAQKSKTVALAQKREREQARAVSKAERERDYHLSNTAELQQHAAALRAIDLREVAQALGYEHQSGRDVWKSGDSTLTLTGPKFFDHEAQKGGGGAIDLAKHATGHSYPDALKWLADRFGVQRSVSTALEPEREKLSQQIEKTEPVPFTAPAARFSSEDDVEYYLTRKRGLSGDLVRSAIAAGDVYGDDRKNAVFLRRDLTTKAVTGCMKRGTQPTRFIQVLGDKKKGWYSYGDQQKPRVIAICESAIDALSFYDLQRRTGAHAGLLVISTDGCGEVPAGLSERYPGAKIIAAQDNDKAGDALAAKIRERYPHCERMKPQRKDWNEDLCQAASAAAAPIPTAAPGLR